MQQADTAEQAKLRKLNTACTASNQQPAAAACPSAAHKPSSPWRLSAGISCCSMKRARARSSWALNRLPSWGQRPSASHRLLQGRQGGGVVQLAVDYSARTNSSHPCQGNPLRSRQARLCNLLPHIRTSPCTAEKEAPPQILKAASPTPKPSSPAREAVDAPHAAHVHLASRQPLWHIMSSRWCCSRHCGAACLLPCPYNVQLRQQQAVYKLAVALQWQPLLGTNSRHIGLVQLSPAAAPGAP